MKENKIETKSIVFNFDTSGNSGGTEHYSPNLIGRHSI